jgi:hypothetical protein
MTKDCPQLFSKWQERGNHNQNLNQNVQNISIEIRDEGPKITTITRGGAKKGAGMINRGRHSDKWVGKSTRPMLTFSHIKKTSHQQIRKEILRLDWITSTSSENPVVDRNLIYD